jgi:lysophospholipase L1-like esterase
MENTHVPGQDTQGGRVFIDAVRTSNNMDLAIGVMDKAGFPPQDSLVVRGSGKVELPRGPLQAAYLLDTPIRTTAENRKVVFFGSSVCLGAGASLNPDGSYKGWAFRLSQRLAAKGYVCVNKSIGGENTVDLLNRFYRDIVPENPDIVVIGLSLANEGLLVSNQEGVYQQYLDNMYRLVNRCRQLGYRVIVAGAYPHNDYQATHYNYIKQINEELDASDIPYVNFLGAIEDGAGHWRAGMYADSGHPNDAGHEAMARAFSVSMFDRLPFNVAPSKYMPVGARGFTITGNDLTPGHIGYVADSPFGSWTLMVRVRRNAGTDTGRALLSGAPATNVVPLRCNNSNDFWGMADAATAQQNSTKNSLDGTLDHIALMYDCYTARCSLFINGELAISVLSNNPALNEGCLYFSVGGRWDNGSVNAIGYDFRDIALYRSALTPAQIKQCYRGWYPKASLEVFSPCFETEFKSGMRLANLAPTSAFFRVTGADLTAKDVT